MTIILLRPRCQPCHYPSKIYRFPHTDKIIQDACDHFELPVEFVLRRKSLRAAVKPRQMLMTYLFNAGLMTQAELGRLTGLDHSTVRYNIKSLNLWRAVYTDIKREYEKMVEAINA